MRSPPSTTFDNTSPETGGYHLLLEDVNDTHRMPRWLPPTRPQSEAMMDTFAQIHAYWWDHPRLGKDIGQYPSADLIRKYVNRMIDKNFPELVDYMGDRLSSRRRTIFETVFTKHPDLWIKRDTRGKHLTFVHADAHMYNFLLPREGHSGRTYLIDWHTFDWYLQVSSGVSDLAYMMAHGWYSEHRCLNEKPLLRRYHQRLQEHGIQGYDWEDLWYDYRLDAMRSLYIVALWGGSHQTAQTMYRQLERAMAAFDDLECIELLGSA